jgi:PDZ domain-containing protein
MVLDLPEHGRDSGLEARHEHTSVGAGRRYISLLVASLSLIALICVTLLLPVPYVVLSPSVAFNTLGEFDGHEMITFPKSVKTYQTTGALDFTTVLVSQPDAHVSLVEAMAAYFSDNSEVVRRRSVYREGESATTSEATSRLLFKTAQDAAKVAALRALDRRVPTVPLVYVVEKGFPAYGKLRVGDVIRAADGRKNVTVSQFVQIVRSKKPGQSVTIQYERQGKSGTVKVATRRDPKPPHHARIGIQPLEMYESGKVMKINFHTGSRIGGSSAGMMFALAIYDRLTPGALTGGKHIAGTGTINVDGEVGPIGGIRQKSVGAASGGATIFLVPAHDCADVMLDADRRGLVHGMQVVRVSKLKDAIVALEALAKDPKAKVPACRPAD